VNYTLPDGANRLLLAAIVSESTQTSGLAGARPTSVTFGTANLTASGAGASDGTTPGFDNPYLYYYYALDATLPAAGAQQLHVTGASGKVVSLTANVIVFTGVDQTSPLVVGNAVSFSNSGGPCPIASPVTTVIPGSALYTLVAGHYAGTATLTNPPGVTLSTVMSYTLNDRQLQIAAAYGGAYPTALEPGTYTPGFTFAWCTPAGGLSVALTPLRR
jgi:hypothetical protein